LFIEVLNIAVRRGIVKWLKRSICQSWNACTLPARQDGCWGSAVGARFL